MIKSIHHIIRQRLLKAQHWNAAWAAARLLMKLLEERICKDGTVLPGNILKVDSFLNHQIDVDLLDKMGEEIKRLFEKEDVTKILTIEASGIGIACVAARFFGVPVLFAKKAKTKNLSDNLYVTKIDSFTHGNTSDVVVDKRFLTKEDRVLIIDDFLAEGNALVGLIDLCDQAGAAVVGCAIAIEKAFQHGAERVRKKGIRVESLAVIKSMTDSEVIFES